MTSFFDFYLLFKGDIFWVLLLSLIYLPYSFVRGIKTDYFIKHILIFVFSFYVLCFIFRMKFSLSDVRGGGFILFVPLLSLYLIFVLKTNKYKKVIELVLIGYILFWIMIFFWHYFSQM